MGDPADAPGVAEFVAVTRVRPAEAAAYLAAAGGDVAEAVERFFAGDGPGGGVAGEGTWGGRGVAGVKVGRRCVRGGLGVARGRPRRPRRPLQ